MTSRVLVFGPTGNVGSIVARTAQEDGAKVFLAMRNLHKPIPGLSPTREAEGGFERIQADLTQPESIIAAVKHSEATSAFMYLAHSSTDHMRATIEASKAAGITFIVFLSSFTIQGDLHMVKSSDHIPYVHARVEMNLQEVYGPKNYVALRAGAFATNTFNWRAALRSGNLDLKGPDTKTDYITPFDMGKVGGKILANGQMDGQHIVYLYGPELISRKDALAVVTNALDLEVESGQKEGQDGLKQHNADDSGKRRVVVTLGPAENLSSWFLSAFTKHEEGASNVVKYTGKPGMSFAHWVEENKNGFM